MHLAYILLQFLQFQENLKKFEEEAYAEKVVVVADEIRARKKLQAIPASALLLFPLARAGRYGCLGARWVPSNVWKPYKVINSSGFCTQESTPEIVI